MNPVETRRKIHQQVDQIPEESLSLVSEFLEFLRLKGGQTPDTSEQSIMTNDETGEPVLRGSTVADLMPFVGTWQGDDFEECLQAVYETRSPAEF
jgi:hypothetical protein